MTMASGDGLVGLPSGEATKELTLQWRRLIRTATAVAILTSPVESGVGLLLIALGLPVYFYFKHRRRQTR